MALHKFIDFNYGPDGDDKLRQMLAEGAGLDEIAYAHAARRGFDEVVKLLASPQVRKVLKSRRPQ